MADVTAAPTLESAVIEAAVDLYRFYVEESLEDADEEDCVKHAEAMLGQVFCERVRAYTEATS